MRMAVGNPVTADGGADPVLAPGPAAVAQLQVGELAGLAAAVAGLTVGARR